MDVAVAVRAGRPGWLNRRTVLGAMLVVISLVGGNTVLARAEATTPVWVVTEDLPGGATLREDAVRVEYVRLPSRLASGYLAASEEPTGYVVTRPLAAGELVPTSGLSEASATSGTRAITVPVDPEHAVGGSLRPGDQIDIFATFDAGDARARTVSLVRGVEVIDLVSAGGLVMDDKAVVGITISVTSDEAQRIAFATRSAQLDVVRIDSPRDRGSASVVTGADF